MRNYVVPVDTASSMTTPGIRPSNDIHNVCLELPTQSIPYDSGIADRMLLQ